MVLVDDTTKRLIFRSGWNRKGAKFECQVCGTVSPVAGAHVAVFREMVDGVRGNLPQPMCSAACALKYETENST